MSSMNTVDVYLLSDAARALQVSSTSVRRWIADEVLVGVELLSFGGVRRIGVTGASVRELQASRGIGANDGGNGKAVPE